MKQNWAASPSRRRTAKCVAVGSKTAVPLAGGKDIQLPPGRPMPVKRPLPVQHHRHQVKSQHVQTTRKISTHLRWKKWQWEKSPMLIWTSWCVSEDNSSDNGRGDESDSASDHDDLPVPHAPWKRKQASKWKTKKAKLDVNWTDKTKDVKTEHKFTPKPTVTHTLPPTATLMDFNPFVPDCFSKHFLSRQTNMPPKSKKLQGEMTNTGQQATTSDENIFVHPVHI